MSRWIDKHQKDLKTKQWVKSLLKKRHKLRKDKKYKESDEIREMLKKMYPDLKIQDEKWGVSIFGYKGRDFWYEEIYY